MIKREKKIGSSHSARREERTKEWCCIGNENLFIIGNKAPVSFSLNCLLFIYVTDSIHHFDSWSQQSVSSLWSFFCNTTLIRCKDSEPREWQILQHVFSCKLKAQQRLQQSLTSSTGSSMKPCGWDKNFSLPLLSLLRVYFQKENTGFRGNTKLYIHNNTCCLNIKHTNTHGTPDDVSADNEAHARREDEVAPV